MRNTVLSIAEAIQPLDDTETGHRLDAIAWIRSGQDLFRVNKPATPAKHLVAYCVVVDTDREQVLLVDHRNAQLWLPPGGHVDPGEHPAVAAERELYEELGIRPPFHPAADGGPLLVTVTETQGLSASHTDVSFWFVFDGSDRRRLSPDEREFSDVRWWHFDDVTHGPESRFEPQLPRFIRKLRAVLATEGSPDGTLHR